jgi:hypothetical protein
MKGTLTMKLTSKMLKKIIEEEASKLESDDLEDEKPEETDADEYADSIEKHVDFVKALKVEEARLMKRLSQIKEQKAKATRKLLGKI